MGMRIVDGKVVKGESRRGRNAFTDAVNAINLGLVLDQLDLEGWMAEYLEEKKGYKEVDTDCLNLRDIALRGICICAMDAKKILISEYGLEESDFAEDVVA